MSNMSLNSQKKEKHLRVARSFMNQGRYGDALAHFVFLSHAEPSFKMQFIEEFITALRRWTEILERHGEFDKVMVCYEQALQLYPQSETILNNMGALLFKLGCHDEAASCFRRALVLNPRCTQAKESLDSVANVLVERWHFRMLNDKKRNEAYKRAICKAVSEGYDIVLDIGSGTGILSMFAVQAGAKKVYACEMSKTMYEMSLDVLAANQMKDSVEVIHKKSMDLKIGKEITSHVSLVVTEILDCGLLGEGIIPTVAHAWECLLQPQRKQKESSENQDLESKNFKRQHAKVIPAKACVYATVISCEAIRSCTRLNKTNIARVDLSSLYIVGGEKISLADVTTDNHVGVLEPYTTECLRTIKGGFHMLTKTFAVAEYNFNDPKTFEKQSPVCFKLPVLTTGSVDAIAMWFDLYLDDEICLNTGPCGRSTCWEQAVYPVYFHHLHSLPEQLNLLQGQLPVEAGDVITIGGEFSDDCLRLQCTGIGKAVSVSIYQEPAPQSGCKQAFQKLNSEQEVENELLSKPTEMCEEQAHVSTQTNMKNSRKIFTSSEDRNVTNIQQVSNHFSSSTQQEQNHAPKVYDEKSPNCRSDNLYTSFYAFQGLSLSSENREEKIDDISGHQTIAVPPSYMRQLNDDSFYSTYCEAIERAVNKVHGTYNQRGDLLLPDLTTVNNPPILTVNDASSIKRDGLFQNESSSVQPDLGSDNRCRVLNVTHGPTLIGPIIAKAGAGCVFMTGLDTSFNKVLKFSNCDFNLGSTRLEDVVSEGKIWDMLVADIVEPSGVLRQQVIEDIVLAKGCLLKPALHEIIPAAVTIHACCVQSPQLKLHSKVTDSSNTLGLDIGRFINHFQVNTHLDVDLNAVEHVALTDEMQLFHIDFMKNFADERELLSLLDLKSQQVVKVQHTGTIHAVPYWFVLHFPGCNNSKLSTYSGAYQGSHWRLAIVLLKEELYVKEGQDILISATCKDSCVSVSVQTLAV